MNDNPKFSSPMRPAYEIPFLFRSIGLIESSAKLTVEQRNMALAADKHARNASDSLLRGLEAVGNLLMRAGAHGLDLEGQDVSALGDVISHMSVEVQFLFELQDEMTAVLERPAGASFTLKGAAQ